jgi:K+-transporting ATPase ATPase B chain
LLDRNLLTQAVIDAFRKLSPRQQWQNPVMFVVYVGSLITTGLWLQAVFSQGEAPAGFILAITLWLWFTVLFANFAEAMAEGRSKAQAASLKSAKRDISAKTARRAPARCPHQPPRSLALADRPNRAGRGGRLHTGRR